MAWAGRSRCCASSLTVPVRCCHSTMSGEKTPVTEVAQVLGVSRATLYRRVPELAEARTQAMMNLDL